MDNDASDSSNRPPATNPANIIYPPSGNEQEAVKAPAVIEAQPPPYTEQQHYGARPALYPTYPSPQTHPTPPGAYPAQQPAVYTQHAGAYPPQQAGVTPYTSTNTVVVTQPGIHGNVLYAGPQVYPDIVGAIVFSCVVVWCCCFVFGIVAFVLAVVSSSSETYEKARLLVNISHGINIAGLCLGILFWIMILVL